MDASSAAVDLAGSRAGHSGSRRETVILKPRQSLSEVDEATLLDRCRRHDYEAFGKLVDAYQARIFGFVKRMVSSPEEASDVTQEVFIKAFQNIHRFDGRASMRTWLFRIAHNLCIDRARKSDRSIHEVSLEIDADSHETQDIPDHRWSPDDLLLNDELMGVVEAGIGTMSEKLRSVLLLHDKEEMSYEEIAALLTIPVGTVKSRLFLARNHLQSVISTYIEGGKR
jgi:RNA polymerase sigma-70 factor (ECF subfamily)